MREEYKFTHRTTVVSSSEERVLGITMHYNFLELKALGCITVFGARAEHEIEARMCVHSRIK